MTTLGARRYEQVVVDETLPVSRCEVCNAPGEWTVSYAGYTASRNPPYRFWAITYCDEHLPDDGRNEIPAWATQVNVPKLTPPTESETR